MKYETRKTEVQICYSVMIRHKKTEKKLVLGSVPPGFCESTDGQGLLSAPLHNRAVVHFGSSLSGFVVAHNKVRGRHKSFSESSSSSTAEGARCAGHS